MKINSTIKYINEFKQIKYKNKNKREILLKMVKTLFIISHILRDKINIFKTKLKIKLNFLIWFYKNKSYSFI